MSGVDEEAVASAAERVRARIADACRRAGRKGEDVVLVAVTKGLPVSAAAAARRAGLTDLGENYASELAAKAAEVPVRWHFLGRVQRGTAAGIARHASVVHSAEPGSGIRDLSRRAGGRPIHCLVQVDFTRRRQGVDPDRLEPFLEEASRLEGIEVVGLMTLAPWTGRPDLATARRAFARLRQVRDGLRPHWPGLRHLSMGMSADYEVAVEEGATMVRIGTALFGERPPTGGPAARTSSGA